MREYRVTVKGKTYIVLADENYEAKSKGVRLYRLDYPSKYTFAYLMSSGVRVHLIHPNVSGRKPMMDFELL